MKIFSYTTALFIFLSLGCQTTKDPKEEALKCIEDFNCAGYTPPDGYKYRYHSCKDSSNGLICVACYSFSIEDEMVGGVLSLVCTDEGCKSIHTTEDYEKYGFGYNYCFQPDLDLKAFDGASSRSKG